MLKFVIIVVLKIMKTGKKLLLITLTLSGITLTSCLSFWSKDAYSKLPDKTLNKTYLQQTYHDYTSHCFFEIDSTPSTGNSKLLVIPIWFTDSSNYISLASKASIRSDIYKTYFGGQSETGWHSVKSYYETESGASLSLDGVVTPWYDIEKSSSYFYSDSTKTNQLVEDAVEWYFAKPEAEDRKSFDADSNGYLDGVMLIYASPDYDSLQNDSARNMWAYCYWLQDSSKKSVSKPGPNTFFWASYDFMYDQKTAQNRTQKSNFGAGDTAYCSLDAHTYIHEMGHCFGLEDYYDYSSNHYFPAGGFSMQDFNIGGHDPFSVMALGWADPFIPTESCKITIGDFQTSHQLILLTNSFNSAFSPFDEYLLLELYVPSGLNQFDSNHSYGNKYPIGSPMPGIRVWHVDARAVQIENSSVIFPPTSDVKSGKVITMMSNTYDDGKSETKPYISKLGSEYANFNLLQMIRRDTDEDYKPKSVLSKRTLFVEGDIFTMDDYSSQFVKGNRFNNGGTFNWSFKVMSVSSSSATIAVKLA